MGLFRKIGAWLNTEEATQPRVDVNKPLEILIVDDSGFDSALATWDLEEGLNDERAMRIGNGMFNQATEHARYRTFPHRLKQALVSRGYNIAKVTVKRTWRQHEGEELPKYDVLISDLGFDAGLSITSEEYRAIFENGRASLEALLPTFQDKQAFSSYENELLELLTGKNKLGRERDPVQSLDYRRKRCGFYPIARQAKDQGRKITLCTQDMGHATDNIILGVAAGTITPQDVSEVALTYQQPEELLISQSGRLVVGMKAGFESASSADNPISLDTVGSYERIFNNWIAIAVTAINYQRM